MKLKKAYKLLIASLLIIWAFHANAQNLTCPIPAVPKDITCPQPRVKGKFYIKNIVKDFGADPKGIFNAQFAFECAANFYNVNGGNGKLIIPFGVYKIGLQQFIASNDYNCNYWTDYGWIGRNLIHLVNCKNFEISGLADKKTKRFPCLKFQDSLKTGGFKENGQPSAYMEFIKSDSRFVLPQNCKGSKDKDTYQASIGSVIYLEECNGVKISDIEIDGNSRSYRLGCFIGAGPAPYENWSHGIVIWNSKNVNLRKISVHDIGCDGILVKNYTDNGLSTSFQNIVLDGAHISNSGRNNISWVGGNGLEIRNAKLSYAGTGIIKTNPSASIDVEPEIHEKRTLQCDYVFNDGKLVIVEDYCFNGLFYNVQISKDRLHGLLNADASHRTKNIIMRKSNVSSKTGLSYYSVIENKIKIEDSKFSGRWNIAKKDGIATNKDTLIKRTIFTANTID